MAPSYRFSLVSLAALGVAMPATAQSPTRQTPQPASQAEPQADSQDEGRDVIVVTANKREESVQDIAVAVTAVTSEMRDEIGISTITDLTNFTPGLSYTAGNERVTLRGIGRNTNNFGAEPGVANYTDGVYQSFASIAGRDNLFIDRIEVLRGPQGTLYGRNSVGGALNIISKRPTDEFEGEFRLGYGSYDQTKVGVSLSGPINDWLRYRAVAYKETRDEGVFYNYGTNSTEGYNIDNYNWEFQLEGDIGDRFSWWTKYTTGGYHQAGPPGGRTTGNSISPYDLTFGSLSGTGAVTPTQTWAYSGNAAIQGYTQCGTQTANPTTLSNLYAVNSCAELTANLDAYNDFALEAIYSFDNFDVKYVGGYIYYDYNLYGDQDGTPIQSIIYQSTSTGAPSASGSILRTIYPEQTLHYHENRAFFSNELNFLSTHDGPLQWISGIYLYQENFAQPIKTFFANEPLASTPQLLNASYIPSTAYSPTTLAAPNPERLLSYTNNTGLNNSYGIFGQIDWQFTDQLKTTLGLRYSVDNKHIYEEARLFCYIQCSFTTGYLPYTDVTQAIWNGSPGTGFTGIQPGVATASASNPTGVTYNPTTGLASRLLEDEWDAVTGTAGLEYTPTSRALLFAKYTRGYKTGGFNATSMAPLPRTKPETVDSYEIGWKQEFDAINLTSNISAFFYDYRDSQIPLTVVPSAGLSYTAFVNIPKVQTTGFEIETIWTPIDNLTVLANYAYLNPEVTDSDVYRNSLTGLDESIEGNVLPQSPENKVAINASYLLNFADGSSLMPSVSWYWRDSFTTSVFNNPESFTPAFDQTDARLIWNDKDGRFTVIGFVRNVFDEVGYDAVTAGLRRSDGQVYQTYTPTLPRTSGVELQFHF